MYMLVLFISISADCDVIEDTCVFLLRGRSNENELFLHIYFHDISSICSFILLNLLSVITSKTVDASYLI